MVFKNILVGEIKVVRVTYKLAILNTHLQEQIDDA